MPENYIALYDAPEQAEAIKIVAAAARALESGIACIREDCNFPVPKAGTVDRLKSGVINAAFYRFIVKANKFIVSDACIGCGKCAESCVLNNIELRGGRPIWGGRCTHCMAPRATARIIAAVWAYVSVIRFPSPFQVLSFRAAIIPPQ